MLFIKNLKLLMETNLRKKKHKHGKRVFQSIMRYKAEEKHFFFAFVRRTVSRSLHVQILGRWRERNILKQVMKKKHKGILGIIVFYFENSILIDVYVSTDPQLTPCVLSSSIVAAAGCDHVDLRHQSNRLQTSGRAARVWRRRAVERLLPACARVLKWK